MRRATTVYSGDLKWRSITVGMSADLFAWLDNMSRARDIANSTLVRELLQGVRDAERGAASREPCKTIPFAPDAEHAAALKDGTF